MSTYTIRALRQDDATTLLAFEQANRAWFERHIDPRHDAFYSLDGIHAHVAQFLLEHEQGLLHPCIIVDQDGKLIGRANLKDIDQQARTAEVGYRIAEQHGGKGLATAALRHLITLAREEWRLTHLKAYAIDGNAASVRVLERCGFVREAVVSDIAMVAGTAVDGHQFLLDCTMVAQAACR